MTDHFKELTFHTLKDTALEMYLTEHASVEEIRLFLIMNECDGAEIGEIMAYVLSAKKVP